MALTQVRATVGGQSLTLTYNAATGRYEVKFNAPIASIQQPGGYYNAEVSVANAAGGTASVTGTQLPSLRLVVSDTAAPTLTVTSPANGLVTAAASVAVTGTVHDISGVGSVTVNGQAVTVAANGSFSATVSLTGGSNTITVRAADLSGNAATVTRTVIRATSGPALDISSPAEGALLRTESVAVSGTVSDSVSPVASVRVNDVAAAITGGTWEATVPLAEGANTLTVVAGNQVGLTTAKTRTVTRDSTAPVLNVTSPAGDLITTQPGLTVSGTASDSGSGLLDVKVNGQTVPLADGAFSVGLTLAEGANTITVIATDRAGNTTKVTRSVLLDTAPPVLTLVSPPEGYLNTGQPEVIFSMADEPGGSGVDLDTVAVYVDGAPCAASVTGGTISLTPTLADGPHVITVTVRDMAGNQRGLSAAYTVDTVPPVMSVKSPYLRHIVDEEAVEITVEASDAGTGVAAVVAGGVTLTPIGNVYTGAVPLAIGENTIQVAAADRAGNQTAEELYMIRLVTDRTEADVERVLELCRRGYDSWTEEERAWWAATLCLRGSYDDRDLNRVGAAVDWLAGELRRRGYIVDASPKTDWTKVDAPVRSQMTAYLADVERVRVAQGLYMPEIPGTMDNLTVDGANAIEQALVEVDAVFPYYAAWTAGETTCGGA